MSGNIITLGREAVITDIYKKIDWVMSCFFFSKHSQSRLFKGKIVSLTKIIQQYGNDPAELKIKTEEKLSGFLNNFFDQSSLTVTVEEPDSGDMTLVIDASVADSKSTGGSMVSIGYSLTYHDSNLLKILETTSGRTLFNR